MINEINGGELFKLGDKCNKDEIIGMTRACYKDKNLSYTYLPYGWDAL